METTTNFSLLFVQPSCLNANIVKHRPHVWPQDLVDRSGTPPAAAKEQAELGRELWEAASQGKAAGVRLLLGAGADPNTVVRSEDQSEPGTWSRDPHTHL